MYKLCIFDLDGTLAQTIESMAVAANRALEELGFAARPWEEFRYFAGDGAAELCRRCLRAVGDAECCHFDAMYARYRNSFQETCLLGVKPYPGIPELLENLRKAKILTAVLSNKPHDQAVAVVEALFGKETFTAILGQRDGIPRKPSPEGALYLAEFLGVPREDCLYIGDTGTDMKTGKAAGMKTVGVLWGFRDEKELRDNQADLIVNRPEEIQKIARKGEEHD